MIIDFSRDVRRKKVWWLLVCGEMRERLNFLVFRKNQDQIFWYSEKIGIEFFGIEKKLRLNFLVFGKK